jgi:hypothetical protein
MQVDKKESFLSGPGQYGIAVWEFRHDINNVQIAKRGGAVKGLATWGMSGCYGVAVFGGQENQSQVEFLAMLHASGGLDTDRLNEFLRHLQCKVTQPGDNFQWVLVFSQGDEVAEGLFWSQLKTDAGKTLLFEKKPESLYFLDGPAPGGSKNAFAVDFDGHWGTLGNESNDEKIFHNAPIWSCAPKKNIGKADYVRIVNPPERRGCCYISAACCRHLGLPDDCEELETLRKYRDDVLLLTHDGRRDIESYYRQAPEIVRRLEGLANCEQVYSVIYRSYLVRAVQLIQAGENEKAHRVYKTLVAELTQYLDMSERPDWKGATLAFDSKGQAIEEIPVRDRISSRLSNI